MASGTNTKSRLFNIHRWDQPWFYELSMKEKLFWIYMEHKANNVGVYVHSTKLAKNDVDIELEASELEETFNKDEEVITHLEKNKFLLVDFCRFQHCQKGPLLPKAKVIVSYLRDVSNSGLTEYFYQHQKQVVSEESYMFLKAFEDGVLEFKYYSAKNSSHSQLSDYDYALEKAKNHFKSLTSNPTSIPSEYHTNTIAIPLLSHKGKGKEISTVNGDGKAKESINGSRQGSGHSTGNEESNKLTPYERSKAIAFQLSGGGGHEVVKNVQTLAVELREQFNIDDPHSEIERVLSGLDTKTGVTFEKLEYEVRIHFRS